MAKLGRVLQKIFGINATAGGVGVGQLSVIGSFAAGSSATVSPNDAGALALQGNSNYLGGWFFCVSGGNCPVEEDMNSFNFLVTRQLAYLFQTGIPEYDATTTYFIGSFVNSGGIVYCSITDNNLGNAITDTANWAIQSQGYANALLNSAFDLWQRGISITVPYSLTNIVYGPDRWAGVNKVGASGVLTMAQVSGSIKGSVYGFKTTVTTPPGVAGSTGASVIHMLDVLESQKFINQSGSFSVWVKAQGNVTAVKLSIVTSVPGDPSGQTVLTDLQAYSPATTTVNSAGFTKCTVTVPALSTLIGNTAIGVQVSVQTVSSGNNSDSGNGFIIEQAMLNLGLPATWRRAYEASEIELLACQKYFEKSFLIATTPADNAGVSGAAYTTAYAVNAASAVNIDMKATKRTQTLAAAITFYNPSASNANKFRDTTSGANLGVTSVDSSPNRITVLPTPGVMSAGDLLAVHWAYDVEIY